MASAADVVAQFNSVVMSGLNNRGTALWHKDSFPNTVVKDPHLPDNLGPQSEASMAVADYTNIVGTGGEPGTLAAAVVFNIVHMWAQQLSRVRMGRLIYFSTVGYVATVTSGSQFTALSSTLALSFPFPSPPMPAYNASPTAGDFDTFLRSLRDRLNLIRGDANYQQTFVACHSSCHSSCHGARGRR